MEALSQSSRPEFRELGDSWQKWLDYTKCTAARVLYHGSGRVCAVTSIANQSLLPTDSSQSYSCEDAGLLSDPYEGELVTWWLYLFGGLPKPDRDALWLSKRPQLTSTEYNSSVINTSASDRSMANYSGLPVLLPSIGPITVQRGLYFSSHEQFKLLALPYLSIPLIFRIYKNAERARTCNSFLTSNPGMFASVSKVTTIPNSTSATSASSNSAELDDGSHGSISAAGISSLSTHPTQDLDVITPSSVFPTLLFNTSIGLVWYKNMLDAPAMQTPYGAASSLRRDGTRVSNFVGWDGKVTVVVALLGGVGDLVRRKMEKEAVYFEFVRVAEREYRRVFNPMFILGEEVELCLPGVEVPGLGVLRDYEMCR